MTELFPVFFAGAILLILSGLEVLFMRLLNRRWWRVSWIRYLSLLLPVGGLLSITVWVSGIFYYGKLVMIIGATVSAVILILIFALMLSLPVSGGFNLVHDFLERRADRKAPEKKTPQNHIPRRRFLKAAAAVIPAAAVTSGMTGVAHAFSDVRVYTREIYYPQLPPALDGLKILHLSDIHIGYYIWLEDVELLLTQAAAFEPDIILATGDLCDRVDVYADLLSLFDSFRTPYGVYSCLGNHEYFRGIRAITAAFRETGVPLLKDNGLRLDISGTPVYLAGADDPLMLRDTRRQFLHDSIDMALQNASDEAFTILLSHRPQSFDYAAQRGVDLTLSGHTHGGQVGFAGQSVFETLLDKEYLWGHYRKGDCSLYTSSGVGHWFPFRLGCPAEAPILVLRRGLHSN